MVTVVDDSRIQFENEDFVTFREVGGLTGLNENTTGFEIKILGNNYLLFDSCLPNSKF